MKVRVLSALVMLVVFIPIIWIGGIPFKIATAFISLAALKEILNLKKSHSEIPLEVVLCSMLSLAWLILLSDPFTFELNYAAVVCIFLLLFLPTLWYEGKEKYQSKDALYLSGMIFLLAITFLSMNVLRTKGLHYLVYVLFITAATDTCAYLVGSTIGKHKVAPKISPKKTIEGCVGGSLFGTILPSIYYVYFIGDKPWIVVIIMTLIISIMGQLGDLFFSKMKRENEIKDFSNLIPGHGGALDRIDSTIFAVLTFTLLISII